MIFYRWIAVFSLLVGVCGVRADGPYDVVTPIPISVTLDESRSFEFPAGILGGQDEVFNIPYLYDSQLQAAKDAGMSMLRYPCGTPSDWLAWDDIESGYWPTDYEKNRKKLTPDEFIGVCRKMDWQPIITVNTTLAGSHNQRNRINPTKVSSIRKGAEYAAEWVRHANVKNNAGVKYWEIGNEVWIWMKEREYPVHVREYSRAMRKVDPSIKIIACGATHNIEFNPTWLEFPDDPNWTPRTVNRTRAEQWTKALLTQAKGDFDYLAPHIYIDGDSVDPIANGSSLFANIDDAAGLIDQQIAWIKEANSPVRLAQTEWMINWHYFPDLKDTFLANRSMTKEAYDKLTWSNSPMYAFVSVLGSADFLGKLIATGYVDIAIGHTMTAGVIAVWDSEHSRSIEPPLLKPAGLAMKFWSACVGQKVVPVTLGHVPTYQSTHQLVPMLTAYATVGKDALNLILINRTPNEHLDVALPKMFNGRRVTKVIEHAISADSWGDNIWQAVGKPEAYPFKATSNEVSVNEKGVYVVRPSRLIRLELVLEPAKVIRKAVFSGNSITRHGPLGDSDWTNNCGMAASSEAKDFVHLLHTRLAAAQSSSGVTPELAINHFADRTVMDAAKHKELADLQGDLYVIEIGDNLNDEECNDKTLGEPYEAMLKAIKAANPDAIIVCVGTWGGSKNKDRLMSAACDRQKVPFVWINNLIGDAKNRATNYTHSGVAWHPSDAGMQAIADAIWPVMASEIGSRPASAATVAPVAPAEAAQP
jgi:alpha-L-arabinofuranosidase